MMPSTVEEVFVGDLDGTFTLAFRGSSDSFPRSALEANEVRSRAGALSRGSELVESQHEFLDLG